ncbi:MAG: peptidase M23, partial [Bacteroidota bacterium]|nr:peptidase M23 [Bacteroidota bacterium]
MPIWEENQLKPVVPFSSATDRLLLLDFTEKNRSLRADILDDTPAFSAYIAQQLRQEGARYGIGGYDEHRTVYSRSKVFDAKEGQAPRRLHLGIDIWGSAGTPVSAPIDGMVHSFAFNDRFGDYGATIILEHAV